MKYFNYYGYSRVDGGSDFLVNNPNRPASLAKDIMAVFTFHKFTVSLLGNDIEIYFENALTANEIIVLNQIVQDHKDNI